MVRLNPFRAVHKALGIVAISSVIVIQEKKTDKMSNPVCPNLTNACQKGNKLEKFETVKTRNVSFADPFRTSGVKIDPISETLFFPPLERQLLVR